MKYWKLAIQVIFICLCVLQSIQMSGQTIDNTTKYSDLTERELIEELKSIDSGKREFAASEIRKRIENGAHEIGEGNIIEHTEEYWKKKLRKIKRWTKYETFESEFGIIEKDRTPNYNDIKAYRLDHMFVLYVKQNSKQDKVKKERLVFAPQDILVKAPSGFTGVWRTYCVHGVVNIETTYKNGIKHGVEKIFYNSGTVCWYKVFEDGLIVAMRNYSEEGKLKSEKVFTKEEQKEWKRQSEYEEKLINKG